MLTDLGLMSTVAPSKYAGAKGALVFSLPLFSPLSSFFLLAGFLSFPEFPLWLGKHSSAGKKQRMLHELCAMISAKTGRHFNAEQIRLTVMKMDGFLPSLMPLSLSLYLCQGILDLLYDRFTSLLQQGKINEGIEFLDQLGLTKEAVRRERRRFLVACAAPLLLPSLFS